MRKARILAISFLALSLTCSIAKGTTLKASEPARQPTNLVFTMVNSYSISLAFTAPSDLPDGYLIVRSVGTASTAEPTDGVTYDVDQPLGNGNVLYTGSATSVTDFLYVNGAEVFYAIYAYNGSGDATDYLTLQPLTGSQQVGNPNGHYYSRSSGNWHDPSTWSVVSHTGPPSDTSPEGTGGDVFIADGHYLNATEDVDIVAKQLFIGTGAVLNLNGFSLSMSGSLWNHGSIVNGGELYSWFGDFQIFSYYEMPVFQRLKIENYGWGDGVRLFTDIVLKDGVKIIDGHGQLVPNGFTVYPCVPPSVQPGAVVVTERSGDHATVQWQKGSGNRTLVVVRNSATPKHSPNPGVAYRANATWGLGAQTGAGNFVVYSGPGSSVTVTGLVPSQQYQFDVYTFNNTGHCYNISTLPKIEVISPADGKTQTNIDLQVRAKLIVGYYGSTSTLEYSIDLCPASDFASGVLNRTAYDPNQYFTGLQYNTKYYTRVKTNASPKYSKVTTFTTAPAHQFTYMVSPVNLAVIRTTTPMVVSSPVSGATTYTIELNTAADFSGIARVQTGGREQKFTGLVPATYYVRIKTNLDDVWGVTRSFSVIGPPPLVAATTESKATQLRKQTSEDAVAVQVSPNPFQERFHVYVSTSDQQPIDLLLTDITGREITKLKGLTNTVIELHDSGTQANGVYLLRVKTNRFIKVVRVVKQ